MKLRHTKYLTVYLAASLLSQRALAQRAPANVVGCYHLTVDKWRPGVGSDSAYHALPRFVVLDSTPLDDGDWRIIPNIDFPHPRNFPAYPRWSVEGNQLELTWSNGFSVTSATLRPTANGWKGKARAKSDHATPWSLLRRPSASIELRRIACP
jgi:hypothetical protein